MWRTTVCDTRPNANNYAGARYPELHPKFFLEGIMAYVLLTALYCLYSSVKLSVPSNGAFYVQSAVYKIEVVRSMKLFWNLN